MLFLFTSTLDFIGCAVSLWLALYLLGRGLASRIAVRAVLVLLTTAVFFLGAYGSLYLRVPGAGQSGALLLTVGLALWCDLTDLILLPQGTRKIRRLIVASYGFALVTIGFLLAVPDLFEGPLGQELWVQRIQLTPAVLVYSVFLLVAGLVILYNVFSAARVRANLQNRYFVATTLVVFNLVGFGGLVLLFGPRMPRVVEDALVFASVILLGISVAEHKTLVERRIGLQDFVVSALAIFGLAALYVWLAWQWSHSPILVAVVAMLAILTHAGYDLVREFLDLLRHRNENEFRAQLHRLENNGQGEAALQGRLQAGIKLLCQVLHASEGFIAVRQETTFSVAASHHSLRIGSTLPLSVLSGDDICEPAADLAGRIAWLAPAFEAGERVAVIGLGHSKTRFRYSNDDLDLLAEAADRVGTIIYLYNIQSGGKERPAREEILRLQSDELMSTLNTKPDPEFVEMVEDSLRHLSDFITLGQFPLGEYLGLPGETHIERGKALQRQLIHAIDRLRPDKLRPAAQLSREWYSYVVLHDAYIEQVPNRDIMARLYISEGTFNRTRRNALRGVARFLLEKKEDAP